MNMMTSRFSASDFQRQSEAGECGLACLAMVSSHHGHKMSLSGLRRNFAISSRGASIKTLIGIADELGLNSRALRCDPASLLHLNVPVILHWSLNHFVVLVAITQQRGRRHYTIADPANGIRQIDEAEFSKHFTGIVLELTPSTRFVRKDQRIQLKLSQLWERMHGLAPALGRILVLSIIIQAIALAMPIYMQTIVDKAVPTQDRDLSTALLIGFLGLWVINTMSSWIRARLIINLSNSLSLQTAVNLFRHTIYLPISWFEKRHLGDVVSRFTSLRPITDLLSYGLVAGIVDGILSLGTFCLMLIYSPLLAAITTGIIIVYAAIKIVFYNVAKYANANILAAQAREDSVFIESIRGISAIKLFCQEGNRQRMWHNRRMEVVDASNKIGKISAGFDTVNASVISLEAIIFIYVATLMVMDSKLTLGMVFAYQAYKQNFVGSTTRLIEQLMSYKLLDVHLDRISDIAFSAPEHIAPPQQVNDERSLGMLTLRGISYSYGRDMPAVLSGLNLEIIPGKTTAIVGPSGVGKSTLLKIICGLLEPQSGGIFIDETPLERFGARRFRGLLGVVSQDDALFAGSLAENISFFDLDYDHEWLIKCCKQAAIHDDIMAMPMGYETSVGDMGSNLSGGQKQRLLLARALYKKPAMLVLDEGTSHLDIETERKVADTIRNLGITRIIVAHRPETIRMADKILAFNGKQLIDVTDQMASHRTMHKPSPVTP